MNLDKNISVIIPVFNAARFVEKAVESALMQPETKEVILIEDGSEDESLEVCQQLAAKHVIIKLFVHPGNANKGAGASRNLGIENASGDFISFLDADDYFLPDRFRAERKYLWKILMRMGFTERWAFIIIQKKDKKNINTKASKD